MAEQMHRMQLLLEPEQRQRLEKIALREERTISDVTRRAIDIGLRFLESGQDLSARRRRAFDQLESFRQEILRQHGAYLGDLNNRIREERSQEQEDAWREQ